MAKVNFDLTKTETFKNSIALICEILNDKRISEDIRAEYAHKYNLLLNPSNIQLDNVTFKKSELGVWYEGEALFMNQLLAEDLMSIKNEAKEPLNTYALPHGEGTNGKCPNCGKTVNSYSNRNECCYCNQKLKWV